MARPAKTSLDYFPFDVDFFEDDKMVAIAGEFGVKGQLCAVMLLCAIYRNGYFIEWNETVQIKLVRNMPGVSMELLNQIVKRLANWDFLDQSLFSSANVLTSRGIQRRFFEATKRCKRSDENLPYLLVNVAETRVNVAETPQNKTKTKQKKITPKGVSEAGAALAPAPEFSIDEVLALRAVPSIARFTPTVHDCEAFYAFYSARGWMMGPGVPMKNLGGAFTNWLKRRSNFRDDRAVLDAERQRLERQKEQAAAAAAVAEQSPELHRRATPEEIAAIMARHRADMADTPPGPLAALLPGSE